MIMVRLCVMPLEMMLNWLVALTNYVAVLNLVLRFHAMTSLFLQHGAASGWDVQLADASNAFNSLNRVALLWNVGTLASLFLLCFQYLSGLGNTGSQEL